MTASAAEQLRQMNASADPELVVVRRDHLEALEAALHELVDLKDGPRDEDYERRKPAAWQQARQLLGRTPPTQS